VKQSELIEHGRACLTPNYRPAPVVFEKGNGAYLTDMNGQEYLDFAAGIAVCALGHNHPAMTEAIQSQAEQLLHVSNLFFNRPSIELARKLIEISFADRVYFANSGAEANEAALKLARRYMQAVRGEMRSEIVCITQSFHGRTWAAISATGQPKYHKGFLPLVPGFVHVPYNDLDAMAAVVSDQTCAIMVEPIQGEGGVIEAAPGYLAGLRALCDKTGALLIFDEVQTGVARTGHWFAHQHDAVTPDIMSLAKGLGGGVPIGAMLCTETVAQGFQPGVHASTFGGNPLVCAASLAVLETVEADDLITHVNTIGKVLEAALQGVVDRFDSCLTVRGRGLMRGIGVDPDQIDRAAVMSAARERGLLITTAGKDAFRLVPPLIINEADVTKAASILTQAIESVVG
jgi:predicted acetylornithine/succinylornithine family transaminase